MQPDACSGNGHPVLDGCKLVPMSGAQAEAAFAVSQREKLDLAVQQLQQQLGKATAARTALEQQLSESPAQPRPSLLASSGTNSTPNAAAASPPATAADSSQLSQPVASRSSGSSAAEGALQSGAPARPPDAGQGAVEERVALHEENDALRREVEQLRAAQAAGAAAAGLRREDLATAMEPSSQPPSPSTSGSNASDKKQAS